MMVNSKENLVPARSNGFTRIHPLSHAVLFGLVLILLIAGGPMARAGNDEDSSGESIPILDPVAEAIQRYVGNRLSMEPSDVKVRILGGRRDLDGLSSQDSMKVKEGRVGKLLGRSLFSISIGGNHLNDNHFWVTADVFLEQRVVVARNKIKRDEIVKQEDLSHELISVTRRLEDYILDPEDAIGMRARRSILKGRPITHDQIEEAPLILRGDFVTILLERKGLRITSMGRAKEDGYEGQAVSVVNLDSRKTIHGIVWDSGTVRVGLTR